MKLTEGSLAVTDPKTATKQPIDGAPGFFTIFVQDADGIDHQVGLYHDAHPGAPVQERGDGGSGLTLTCLGCVYTELQAALGVP